MTNLFRTPTCSTVDSAGNTASKATISRRVATGLALLSICVPLLFGGCGWESSVDKAILRIDRLIDSLTKARLALGGEFEKFRSVLESLPAEFERAGSTLIARDLRTTIEHGIGAVGREARCNVDFVAARLDTNLKNLIAVLRQKKEEISSTRKLSNPIETILASLEFRPVYVDPSVCDIVPAAARFAHDPRTGRMTAVRNHEQISVTGWGLIAPPGAQWKPALTIRSANGPSRDASDAIAESTTYLLTINLQVLATKLRPGDVKLELTLGTTKCVVNIVIEMPAVQPSAKTFELGNGTQVPVVLRKQHRDKVLEIFGGDVVVMSASNFKRRYQASPVGNPFFRIYGEMLQALQGSWQTEDGLSVLRLPVPPGGDAEFAGHGPLFTVTGTVAIGPGEDRVILTVGAQAAEWKNQLPYEDFTFASGSESVELCLPADLARDWKISKIESRTRSGKSTLMAKREADLAFVPGDLLASAQIVGDGKGKDLGHSEGARVTVTTQAIRLVLTPK